jgi:hypothetical protein
MLSKLNNEQATEAKIKLQAIMKEIEAERERDMAITSPTRPLFYMPPTIRPGAPTTPVEQQQPVYYDAFNASYASTSSEALSFDALHYLPPLDTSFSWQPAPGLEFLDQDFSFDLPPLTDDMDCSSSGSVEDEDYDEQLQQIISSLPDGRIPPDDWTTSYPELNELIAASAQDLDMAGLETFTPSFELPEYITEAFNFQDEAFRKSLDAELEAVIASMPMPDIDADAPTPVPPFLQEGIVTEEPAPMETDAAEPVVI